jgi:hypothetical protein
MEIKYHFRRKRLMHVFEVILSVLLTVALSGCYHERPNNVATANVELKEIQDSIDDYEMNSVINEEILILANNEKSADELIKTVYTEDELINRYGRLSRLLQERPPECMRYSNGKIYLIYKYEDNNYLFALYDYDLNNENPYLVAVWYLGKRLYLDDFEELYKKNAMLSEVEQVDPHWDALIRSDSSSTSINSFHFTVDGYFICLEYEREYLDDNSFTMKISKMTKSNNTFYDNFLPIDRALIESIK